MQSLHITKTHLETLNFLKCANILSPFNSAIVSSYQNPERLYEAVSSLSTDAILTNETFQLVARVVDPNQIADALSWLKEQNLLSLNNIEVLAVHKNLPGVIDLMYWLITCSNLTQVTFDIAVKHASPELLARALCSLNKANILTDENFALLAVHTDIANLTVVIDYLDDVELVSQTTFNRLIQHTDIVGLHSALFRLFRDDMLTEQNFYLVAKHRHPEELAKALCILEEEDLFTSDNINALLGHPLGVVKLLIKLADSNLLNSVNRNLAALHPYPSVLKKVLSLLSHAGLLIEENFKLVAQHQAPALVLESLGWLKYNGILTQKHLTELLNPAHQKLLIRSKRIRICAAVDASDLAYDWENILRVARSEISTKVVIAKLTELIKQEVLQYLSTLASPSTAKEAIEFNALMRTLDAGKMILLWPHIQQAVADGFFNEFHSFFESKQNRHFINYIDFCQVILGQYASFGVVSTLQKQFSESDGYRQLMRQNFHLSATFFSATQDVIKRRHHNPYIQELYDRQFGLALR